MADDNRTTADKLVSQLLEFVGESGVNEDANDTLYRLLKELRTAREEIPRYRESENALRHTVDEFRNANVSIQTQLAVTQGELAAVKRERDEALAFARRCERDNNHFERLAGKEMAKLAELPLNKQLNEGISDAVARVIAERDQLLERNENQTGVFRRIGDLVGYHVREGQETSHELYAHVQKAVNSNAYMVAYRESEKQLRECREQLVQRNGYGK